MTLISPGVQVSVIDNSFYTPSQAGTVPLFIVASAANKTNPSNTGIAPGTLASNYGTVYLLSSQGELATTFGYPIFYQDASGNPIHAGEQNEYGLQAAYSYLGAANAAFVVRADLDLASISPQATQPGGTPANGTFWVNTANTNFGVFQWNANPITSGGQVFNSITPTVILDPNLYTDAGPIASYGQIGNYAIVPGGISSDDHILSLYYKSRFDTNGTTGTSATWVLVGSTGWKAAWPTVQATSTGSVISGNSISINSITVTATDNTVATLVSVINSDLNTHGVGARIVDGLVQLYVTSESIDVITIGNISGTILTVLGITAGNYYSPKLALQPHTSIPNYYNATTNSAPRPTGSLWVKTTTPNAGANWSLNVYNSSTALWNPVTAPLYATNEDALVGLDSSGGGINIPVNTAYVQYDFNGLPEFENSESADPTPTANFRVMRRAYSGPTVIYSTAVTTNLTAGTYHFVLAESLTGLNSVTENTITVTITGATSDAGLIASAINNRSVTPFQNIVASVNSSNQVVITHVTGGEILFADASDGNAFVDMLGLQLNTNVYATATADTTYVYVGSNWAPMTITLDTSSQVLQSFYISNTAPETLAVNGTIWYNSIVDQVDIMVHNGNTWVGYQTVFTGTDPNGPIVSASQPLTQSDSTPIVNGDIWINTTDLENYPVIYQYNTALASWVIIDTTDQTTGSGIIFADARAGTTGGAINVAPYGTIQEMLTSNYLDFDAPDPSLYPRGTLLWNLRWSGFNVKQFDQRYIPVTALNLRYQTGYSNLGNKPIAGQGDSQAAYYPHRWVSSAPNQNSGAGSFGRIAQREVVIQSLKASISSNQQLLDIENKNFTLMACPGYPELMSDMVTLNNNRNTTSFVIGDSPARLSADTTTLNAWSSNINNALADGDQGLVTYDDYLGVWYLWGYTTDTYGNNIVVPPSHMVMHTITVSDQVSYPWFAPAGTSRGAVTNASSVGYVDKSGNFVNVALNQGQRDKLVTNKVNTIPYYSAYGLILETQLTRASVASALDRINVARLIIYLSKVLQTLAKPYIEQPNDTITRNEIAQRVGTLLNELVGLRAITDYLVVCDTSNNTPATIDANELYVDVAIVPVKAVEFIYIPIVINSTSTGAIITTG